MRAKNFVWECHTVERKCIYALKRYVAVAGISIVSVLISREKLATVVEGDQKSPFSIGTIPRCRGGRYPFSWIAPLYSLIYTLYCWVLSKEVSSTIFKVPGMTQPGIEPRSSGLLANTLLTRNQGRFALKRNKLKNGGDMK